MAGGVEELITDELYLNGHADLRSYLQEGLPVVQDSLIRVCERMWPRVMEIEYDACGASPKLATATAKI